MLQHLPHWLGAAFGHVRAGADALATATADLYGAVPVILSSPAFADGARLPERFTADGEGVSPPLTWGRLPQGTERLLLIVEDPDAPLPRPAVHAIVAGIGLEVTGLEEGAIRPDGDGGAAGDTGRNSYGREGWLPPDPPPGHGVHHYVFQLFALGAAPPIEPSPGRGEVEAALKGPILGVGMLTGTYSREEGAPTGLVGTVAPAAGPLSA
jgi:Raf kinase inhibitor-like YbhB/YbcL family protein